MIFLSHGSKDRDVAKRIKKELENEYYRCFLSGDDIDADEDWHQRIWRELRDCDALLGLVTPHFNASGFCQQELGAALAFDKPRLLVLERAPKPPGFAARFQACKRTRLLQTLNTSARFRAVRVAAWIESAKAVDTYRKANAAHDRFADEWDGMHEGEKLQWLLNAAGNSQIVGEEYKSGPFFRKAKKELRRAMTDQWLLENDTQGLLHDRDANPLLDQTKRHTRTKAAR
jgi:hypothetical protein